MTVHRRVLVMGGARSGKSRTAQEIAEASSAKLIYIATAQAFDGEMRERIARHRSERDSPWRTREEPLDLAAAIRLETGPDRIVLVDCLTLWLSNMMLAERHLDQEAEHLLQAVSDATGPLILVSNEVGHGIVPATPLGRAFRDEQGRLNQRMAAACDAVVFVAAGCSRLLKPAPPLEVTLA
jgi:adenosylcobinamide kinase / adenosylcobinamide-phosphate guanylyltransferase